MEEKKSQIRFSICHDLELLTQAMGHQRCFERGSKAWEVIAKGMKAAFPELGDIAPRTCKERVEREVSKFKVNDRRARRQSGVEEEFTEKDKLLQELLDRQIAEQEKVKESLAAKTKVKEKKEKAIVARENAMATLSKKRPLSVEDEGTDDEDSEELSEDDQAKRPKKKKKARKSSDESELVTWLKDKTAGEQRLREREIALKERELALREREAEAQLRHVPSSTSK